MLPRTLTLQLPLRAVARDRTGDTSNVVLTDTTNNVSISLPDSAPGACSRTSGERANRQIVS
jgi:hypothetical protein